MVENLQRFFEQIWKYETYMQLDAFVSRHLRFPSTPLSTPSYPPLHSSTSITNTISNSTPLLPTSALTSNPWNDCSATGSFPPVPPRPNPPSPKASSTPPAFSPSPTQTCPGTRRPARASTLVRTRRTGPLTSSNHHSSTTLGL